MKRAISDWRGRTAGLACILAFGVLSAVPLASPATTSVAFGAGDDTYASGSKTRGAEAELVIDGKPLKRTYIKFTVGGLTQPVTRATLRLYPLTSSSTGFQVRATSTGWTEATLTASNAPAPSGTVTASSGSVASGAWESLDVTALVSGNGTFAFALTPPNGNAVRLASKERGAGTAPQLVVETQTASTSGPATTAPTTTTTPTTTTPPPTTTTAPTGDPVIAVAGDIAGDGAGDSATALLLDNLRPTAVLTAGDNAYNDGTLSEFNQWYEPTWGRHKAKTYPTPGNHEYHTGGTGYYQYFGARAGPAGKGFYSYNIGSWHLIALNSEIANGSGSEQLNWLRTDLAANTARCVLAYWHKPRWSAGNYGDNSTYAGFWTELYNANADVVVNGHDHNYQRYKPMNPSGAVDTTRGIREFVVGTGGRSHYGVRADSRRDAGDGGTYGVLKLTLHATSYDWQFIPEGGRTYTDSGTGACH